MSLPGQVHMTAAKCEECIYISGFGPPSTQTHQFAIQHSPQRMDLKTTVLHWKSDKSPRNTETEKYVNGTVQIIIAILNIVHRKQAVSFFMPPLIWHGVLQQAAQ